MKALRSHLIVLLLYLGVALVITWPLVTVIGTHFAGYPFGDAHEMTRHIWWFTQALRTGAPLIDQPLLGYPDGMPGVILWSDPLQFFPAWLFALVLPLPAAYNLQALLNLALNGWAAWLLMRRMLATNEETPAPFQSPQGLGAWVAGLVFMTAPTIQGHLAGGHGGLLVQWPLPLLALVLWNALRTPRPSLSIVFRIALFTFLVPLGHTLQLIYAVMPLAGAAGITLLLQRRWRALILVMIGVGLGGVVLGLFLIPVWGAGTGTQAYTDAGGSVAYSIDLLAPLTPSFNHPLWGNLDYTHHVLGVNLVEGSTYIGLIAGVLAVIGLWRVRPARWWLLPLLICWVTALGPLLKVFDQPLSISTGGYASFIPLPWALVADLPGIELARTPGRFNFVIALIVAVLAGSGVQAFWAFQKDFATSTQYALGRWAIVSLLTVLIIFDYQSYWPLPTYDASLPQVVADLRDREDIRAVFDIPVDNLLAAKDALWLQTAHEQPLIAGQVTRQTPVSAAKLALLEATLSPALLTTVGADVVILHRHYDPSAALYQRASQALGTPFYEDAHLALFNVPTSGTESPARLFAMPVTNDQRTWHLYAPEAGWFQIPQTELVAPRSIQATWADEPFSIQQEPLDGGYRLSAPLLPVPAAGFYTLTFTLQPTCPITTAPLSCPTWPEGNPGLIADGFFIPQPTAEPVAFANGVTLVNALVSSTENAIGLWWDFEAALPAESIRFIKILNPDGTQVAGWDFALPAAIGRVADRVEIPAGTLIADQTYRVCIGWYTLPDVRRFPVLTPIDGAVDGLACIAEIQAPGG
ncbi:MAG: hypothetical protein J0M33_04365 [Anaerolineae bacterium]|nr:hypothetical protein [Anaerolineae bacterium]